MTNGVVTISSGCAATVSASLDCNVVLPTCDTTEEELLTRLREAAIGFNIAITCYDPPLMPYIERHPPKRRWPRHDIHHAKHKPRRR